MSLGAHGSTLDLTFSNVPIGIDADRHSINGGHVGALLLRYLRELGERRHPRSASFRYLAPTEAGGVEIGATLLRASTARAVYAAEARQAAGATTIAHLDLGDADVPPPVDLGFPAVGDPYGYADVPTPVPERPRFSQRVEYRLVAAPPIFGGADTVEQLAWLRPADGIVDAATIAFLGDCMHATPLFAARAPMRVVTTDYQIHWIGDWTSLPAGTWILGAFSLHAWSGRWAIEDGRLWDADGRLLATTRQTRRTAIARPADQG